MVCVNFETLGFRAYFSQGDYCFINFFIAIPRWFLALII